jgi:hypothetical protein
MYESCTVSRLSFVATITVIAVSLGANAFGAPQESTISITDASRADSPISITGTVLATEEDSGLLRYSFRTDASLTNVSRRTILAVIVRIDTTGAGKIDLHNTRKNDYFFAEAFQPDTTLKLEESAGPFGEPQAEAEAPAAQPARTVASVKFVQFGDGVIWGDPAAGQDILQERRLAWDQLSSLANTYRTSGEQQFVEELKKPAQLILIEYLQKLYDSNGHDAVSVIKKLTSMIEYADGHQRNMHP